MQLNTNIFPFVVFNLSQSVNICLLSEGFRFAYLLNEINCK